MPTEKDTGCDKKASEQNEKEALSIPHPSKTSIHAVENVLEKIIPVLHQDYCQITDPMKRQSFREYILEAIKNISSDMEEKSQEEQDLGTSNSISEEEKL